MAESKRDYYEVLGVDKNADDAALKKVMRESLVDNPMEEEGSHGSKEAHDEGEDNHECPLAHVLHPPLMQPLQHRRTIS